MKWLIPSSVLKIWLIGKCRPSHQGKESPLIGCVISGKATRLHHARMLFCWRGAKQLPESWFQSWEDKSTLNKKPPPKYSALVQRKPALLTSLVQYIANVSHEATCTQIVCILSHHQLIGHLLKFLHQIIHSILQDRVTLHGNVEFASIFLPLSYLILI